MVSSSKIAEQQPYGSSRPISRRIQDDEGHIDAVGGVSIHVDGYLVS